MKAVVFKGPHKIAVEDRPIPTIVDSTDVIIKVSYTALCGRLVAISSALYGDEGRTEMGRIASCMYSEATNPAGLDSSWSVTQPAQLLSSNQLTNSLQGHEFTGEIVEVGPGVKDFKRGDKVVAPFTASW